MLLIVFCGYFCSSCKLIKPKLLSQSKHEKSKPNSKLTTEVERKLEPHTEEKWSTAEILQVVNFRNLQNFAGYEVLQPALPPFFTSI